MALTRTAPVVAALALGGALLVAAPASAAASSSDAAWLQAAHQYNLTEIAAGRAAQTHHASSTVRGLGQMFITDHTAGDRTLRATAARLRVSLPSAPDVSQQQQLSQASAHTGSAFDALFLRSQTSGHRQALAATRTEAASGRDRSVRALATSTAPVVQRHLTELLAAQSANTPTSINAGTGGQAAGGTLTGPGVAALGLVLLAGAGAVAARRSRRVG